jgi:hypothetical protein
MDRSANLLGSLENGNSVGDGSEETSADPDAGVNLLPPGLWHIAGYWLLVAW